MKQCCETVWKSMLRAFPPATNTIRWLLSTSSCCETNWSVVVIREASTSFVAKTRTIYYFLQQTFSTCIRLFWCETSLYACGKTCSIDSTCFAAIMRDELGDFVSRITVSLDCEWKLYRLNLNLVLKPPSFIFLFVKECKERIERH